MYGVRYDSGPFPPAGLCLVSPFFSFNLCGYPSQAPHCHDCYRFILSFEIE